MILTTTISKLLAMQAAPLSSQSTIEEHEQRAKEIDGIILDLQTIANVVPAPDKISDIDRYFEDRIEPLKLFRFSRDLIAGLEDSVETKKIDGIISEMEKMSAVRDTVNLLFQTLAG